METTARLNGNDLHLRFSRREFPNWQAISSPLKYFQPARSYTTANGTLYLQGTCVDEAGREFALGEISDLIDKYGEQAINYLDGSFVLAVDDRRHGIWCAVDHSATMPLYFSLNEHELVITTRPESIKIEGPNDLDVGGIITALNTGYSWGGLTLLKKWKVLRPGQILSIDKAFTPSIKNYFDPELDEEVQGFTSPDELLKEIEKALISISSRYKKLLVPLSGGVDSRLISLQCHKLGIPFEAITFVADVSEGDDFDIASRLAKIYNVKHHRWDWSASKDTIENFKQLCIGTGGTVDAFTTYPDGMKIFTKVASEFDSVVRGDHSFGFGSQTDSLFQSAYDLCINFKDGLCWTLQPSYQNRIDIESIFEKQEQVSVQLKGAGVNHWRHRSRRLTRNPRQHLPIGQLQAQFNHVSYPLLTRTIVERMARTEIVKKNNKLIAHEALAIASPPDIKRIPHNSKHTWQSREPLLSLPAERINEMVEVILKPSHLSEIINETAIVEQFRLSLNSGSQKVIAGNIKSSVKKLTKKLIPKSVISNYRKAVSYPKVASHMIFKRLFAMKVYLDSVSE